MTHDTDDTYDSSEKESIVTTWRVEHGNCLEVLLTLESESIDAVITDPSYPMIKRDYGMLTVEQWWDLMMGVCAETRRVLKPTGSAVFILQPNSEHVGQMRGWLWEFMAWVCREWNMVQDVWWWNHTARPDGVAQFGLLRGSVKACVWCGVSNCYREQANVFWRESDRNRAHRMNDRLTNEPQPRPKGSTDREKRWREAVVKRGGVTPFNLIPIANNDPCHQDAGSWGHGAGTPLKLADWWTRYIVPPGGVVLDPFFGSGTMGIAALAHGCSIIGIEKEAKYCEVAQRRLEQAPVGLGI